MFEVDRRYACVTCILARRLSTLVYFVQVFAQSLIALRQSLRHLRAMVRSSRGGLVTPDHVHCREGHVVVRVGEHLRLTEGQNARIFVEIQLVLFDLRRVVLLVVDRASDLPQHTASLPLAIYFFVRPLLHSNDPRRLRHRQFRSPVEATARSLQFRSGELLSGSPRSLHS